ncbi:MAG: hypothetical protein KGL39_22730 [Patescibacteria group bacterium]|nr:hypothetical protein [Patescibacteria group bacterium]
MAGFITTVATLDFHLLEMAAEIEAAAQVVVETTAEAIRQGAQANAAVDTGAMKTALYVSTATESDYASVTGEAHDLNPKADVLDEVERPAPGEAIVAEAMSYGEYQEYGTSRMPAHPYLTPAAEAERANFLAAMEAIVK